MTGDELYVMDASTKRRVKAKHEKNPLESLKRTMLFHVNGWDSNFRDAWMNGIVNGYDWDDDYFKEICKRWNWNDEDAKNLKELHEKYEELLELCDNQLNELNGQWLIKVNDFHNGFDMKYAECSRCGHTESVPTSENMNFCPKCGKRMK